MISRTSIFLTLLGIACLLLLVVYGCSSDSPTATDSTPGNQQLNRGTDTIDSLTGDTIFDDSTADSAVVDTAVDTIIYDTLGDTVYYDTTGDTIVSDTTPDDTIVIDTSGTDTIGGGNPTDTSDTVSPNDTIPPAELLPIDDIVYVNFTALNYDSLGSKFPLFVRTEFKTKKLYSCTFSRIASDWSTTDSTVVFDFLGVEDYNCFAGPGAPATLGTNFGFTSETARIVIRYDGKSDVYEVSEGSDGETIVTVISQSFTELRTSD